MVLQECGGGVRWGPGGLFGRGGVEDGEEVLVGDFDDAELLHVGVGQLGVQEGKAACAEVVPEVQEAGFAGVGAAEVWEGEHALAEECRAEVNAVEATDEGVG